MAAKRRQRGIDSIAIVEAIYDLSQSQDDWLRHVSRAILRDREAPLQAVLALVDEACRDDIALSEQITPELLLSGGEIHTRIRCGNRAMGYSLFYGVWEFLYEKVIFPYAPW